MIGQANITFDVAVVGGGIAGLVAALTAARAGAETVLIYDARRQSTDCGETLPSIASGVLRGLELLDLMAPHPRLYGVRSLWNDTVHETSSMFSAIGNGWRLDKHKLQKDLLALVNEFPNAAIVNTVMAKKAMAGTSSWSILAKNNAGVETVIKADAVIDAAGRGGSVTRQLVGRRLYYDRLVGALMIERIVDDRDDGLLSIESTQYGWWYSVVAGSGCRVYGLMTDSDMIRKLGAMAGERWHALRRDTRLISQIASEARGRPPYPSPQHPIIVAANSVRLERVAGNRWAAAGDAAITFDPLSSQGVTTAMMTGRQAAISVLNQLSNTGVGPEAYSGFIDRLYSTYLVERLRHYREDEGWRNAEFWSRR